MKTVRIEASKINGKLVYTVFFYNNSKLRFSQIFKDSDEALGCMCEYTYIPGISARGTLREELCEL